MIILGWIVVFFLFAFFVAILARDAHETFLESFKNSVKALFYILSFVGICGILVFWVVVVFFGIFKSEHVDKPTALKCNGVIVAESINGFAYDSRGGTYEDYRSNLTYTARQGEVCKELLKENK